MVLTYFDKIVYYQICDFLYDEFESQKKQKIGYQTFSNMCAVIGKKITLGVDLTKKERGIVNRIISRIISFFGFIDEEAIDYVYNFFKDNFWLKYQSSIYEINVFFKRAKNI
jgi:hypothetical protein